MELSHLSYSSIATWLLCARSWRYRYIDKVETPKSASLVFGSAFHNAIEEHLRSQCKGEPTDILSKWQQAWQTESASPEIDWGDSTPEQLSNDGLRMLGHKETLSALEKLQPLVENGEPVIERRIELRVPGVPVPIIGYIDMIGNDGTLFDFKTAGRSWTQEKAGQEDQPTYYLAALQQGRQGLSVPGNHRNFTHVVWTKGRNPHVDFFATTRNINQIMALLSNIRIVWHGIESGVFPANTNTWKHSSKYCEFWPICLHGGKT